MKRNLLIASLFLFTLSSMAQDLHYSQFRESPLTLNPALTGFFEGRMRTTLNHRNQWLSIPVPYTTYSASIDGQVFKRKHRSEVLGIGLNLNSDIAGDSRFGTSQVLLSASYMFALDERGSSIVSVGGSGGYVQRSIDYTKLYFDNQFNGSVYDPALPTGEIFLDNAFSYIDLSAGANWFFRYDNNLDFQLGAAFFHINKPEQSLLDDREITLDRKGVAYVSSTIHLSSLNDLEPAILYTRQGSFTDLIFGVRLHQEKNTNPANYSSLAYGLFFRNKDAVILNVLWTYHSYVFGISYDLNVSSLARASNLRGGYEFSVSYIMNPRQRDVIKPIPCPIF